MSKTKLSAQNLNLYFDDKHVLKEVNIYYSENRVTALIGPSGCGKSTLLRCFNRMHDLNTQSRITGTISLENIDIYDKTISVTDIRRRIGMVFQKPNPLPKSIYDNLAYGLLLHKIPKVEIPFLVEQALKSCYLWEEVKNELKKPAFRLSGGQQQRLCIARTIILKPEVILMDEPCSALDPISTAKVEELILNLRKNYTVVVVTHNMQQAQRIADDTAFMYLGQLIEKGPTRQIFENPKDELTKNYVSGVFG